MNQAPYMVGATNRSIRENETQHTTAAITVYDVDGPGGGLSLTATATNSLAGVTVSGPTQVGASNATFTLTFAPQTNQFGSATVKLVASDGSASRTNTFTLTVIPVNQPPTFTLSSNVVVAAENAGSVYVTNFLTGLSAGPPNEASQTFAFSLKTVTNQSTNLTFITAPAIKTVGANGMLFFKTTTNSFGTNDVTIIMLDSGTTNNGGIRGYTNAFQLQVPWSNQPPFIAWATNRSLNENQTTNLTVTLDVFDTDSPVTNLSLTASSTNTALVDASITGTRVSNGTNLLCDLTFAPKTNAFGSTYITLVASDGLASRTNTFKLTVNFIDQPPTFILTTNLLLIPEGAGLLKLTNLIIGVSPGPTNEKNQTLTFTVCTGTNQATNVLFQTYPTVKTNSAFDAYTNGLLTFQTATNSYGTNLVWVVLTDSGVATNGGCNTYSNWFTLGVVRTNQAPYFIGATNRTWFEDSTSNATAVVSLFDIDSPGSSLSLSASSSDTSIMNVSVTGTNAVGGTNADFVLGFTLVPNTSGKVVITLVGTDGQAYRTNSFVITVNRVNHPPLFDLSTNLVRFARNCGPISLTNFVTNCAAGPPNESDQRWSFTVVTSTNDATNVTFQAYPTLGTNNTFAFQTQTNAWGTNTVTILMQDNGGAANGGIDTYSNSFQMEIYWVEIPPAILGATNYSLFENSSTNLTMTLTVSSVSVDASNVTLSASSSDLTLADVAVSPPYSLTSTTAVFTLTFIPQAGAAGSNTITLVANDGVASSTNTLMLTILPVNQPPYFHLLTGELTLYENSGFVSINYFADNMSVGPDNESGQTWTFVVTNIAPGASNVLFSTAPNIATNGTFTFRTRTNSFGTNLFAVIMRDSGGTANGAVDSYTNYFSFEIGFSNQPPWIAGAGAQTLLENAATNLSLLLYDFDSPGNTLSLAASTTNTGLVSVSVTGPNSVGATNATFMLNLATVANANGRANIMLVASDGQNSRTNNLSLNIIAVNQTPSFRFATNELAADEDAGAVSLANFVTNISVGPPNESGQTWTFTVECATDDPTNVTFLAFPAVATNGTLTFCTDIESFGTNTVTVIMQDSGGVGYGAINTFTNSFVLEVADASALPAVAFARAPAEVAASVPPFAARQGAYAGLFFETNCLANDSSGYFALVLDATGAFSGYVLSAGQSNQFAGQFGASDALAVVAIPGVGLMNLSLDAGADSADGISGSVVAATGWNATLLGLLKTGGTPAPQAGAYQLILPGRSDPACGPADASRLNLSVSPDGQVLLSGSLADNTGVNQQGQISRDGQFPLYVSCGAAGSLSGWLGWDANADHPWQGSLLWIRSGADAELGFTNQVQVISSRIEAPANGSVRSRKS